MSFGVVLSFGWAAVWVVLSFGWAAALSKALRLVGFVEVCLE